MIDIHSHIIPGVDDGARNFDESVGIIKELAAQGVTDIIASPHFVNETIYVSPAKSNKELLEKLRGFLKDEGVEVNLYLGNEIFIDEDILGLLKKGLVSPLVGSKYLLVELPFSETSMSYEDIFASLLENGYKVLLAHPERYPFFHDDYEKLVELYKNGVLFQCNMASLVGKYGKNAFKTVRRLAKDDFIFAFGNDAHHFGHNGYVKAAMKKLSKYYDNNGLKRVLEGNAKKILA